MSPFLKIDPTLWTESNGLAFAIEDKYPVSPGHTLVITKREIPTWFDATADEQRALFELVEVVKQRLDATRHPDGYNVGFNAGAAAGQTVDHLHVHVIPRYEGDMRDPSGGVRHVIPHKGNYLPTKPSALVTPQHSQMRLTLADCLTDARFPNIDLLVAFVMRSGVDTLAEPIEAALARGAHLRLLTTDYLFTTDADALKFFFDRLGPQPSGGSLAVRVHSDPGRSFHPKAYLFLSQDREDGLAFVGSSNLSKSALRHGIEWNLETADVQVLAREFNRLWANPKSIDLTGEWLLKYEARRREVAATRIEHRGEMVSDEDPEPEVKPWSVQQEALDALAQTRLDGHRAGLVVMATGLGKTWLAAFDSSRPGIKRVLFVAHREEILKGARDVFRRQRTSDKLTMFVGDEQDTSGDVVFASIQSLYKNLDKFDPEAFDYIVVDEFHHAAAPTYRHVIGHFKPKFLLGLTATPDRTDAADLLALCDDNLVYECGLVVGLERQLLSPFKYRAIKDVADYEHIPWKAGRFVIEDLAQQLETLQRAQQVFDEWTEMGGPGRRAIGFCCSISHADFMASQFKERGFRAASVHTGPTSDDRFKSLALLEDGELDVVFSVDLFNEGIDLPAIDIVLMLRPTESPIVFFQQLGRGLRKSEGKTHLDVLDLVGNHRSFLMKARLLAALGGGSNVTDREAVELLKEPMEKLPDGCSIIVDTEALDLMQKLLGAPTPSDRLAELARNWVEEHDGERPTALELSLRIGDAFKFGKKKGGWFGFLSSLGLLNDEEQQVYASHGDLLADIEYGNYTKSFKLVTLQVLVTMGKLRTSASLLELATSCRWRIFSDPRLLNDLSDAESSFVDVLHPTEQEWLAYWRKNPIAALTTDDPADGKPFSHAEGMLIPNFQVDDALGATFDRMMLEIVEYRLHRYLIGKQAKSPAVSLKPKAADGRIIDAAFRVETALGQPISVLFESAGGSKGKNERNVEYVLGLDTVLARLVDLGATVVDAYVDSTTVKALPLAQRRVIAPDVDGPVVLKDKDLFELRKSFLKRMAKVGQAPGAKGNGNSRKALRVCLGGVDRLDARRIARALVDGGALPGDGSPQHASGHIG